MFTYCYTLIKLEKVRFIVLCNTPKNTKVLHLLGLLLAKDKKK
jgi:hypothetical protein